MPASPSPTTLMPAATALRRSIVRLARRFRAVQSPSGTTQARISVLSWLHHRGPMSAGELAAADSLQPQSVTRLLASLERDGLIGRESDEQDRRRSVVRITKEGLQLLRADARRLDAWLAASMEVEFTPAEREVLIAASALLDRLAQKTES